MSRHLSAQSCPQVHRRDLSKNPTACGPCGQPSLLTTNTVAALTGFFVWLTNTKFPTPSKEAEQSFRAAIDLAREQKAKWWELRATTSLARLLASQGHRDEAGPMLTDIYNWFTEGFDSADLIEAKALLDELSA